MNKQQITIVLLTSLSYLSSQAMWQQSARTALPAIRQIWQRSILPASTLSLKPQLPHTTMNKTNFLLPTATLHTNAKNPHAIITPLIKAKPTFHNKQNEQKEKSSSQQQHEHDKDQQNGSWWQKWWRPKTPNYVCAAAIGTAFLQDQNKIKEIFEGTDQQQKDAITQAAVNNIAALAQTRKGFETIRQIVELNPEAVKPFTQAASTHFETLVQTEWGYKMIYQIMELDPDAAKPFTQAALTHFETLAQTEGGDFLIIDLIRHNLNATTKLFTQAILQHFNTIAQTEMGYDIIKLIIKHNPGAIKAFTQAALQYFKTIAQTWQGRLIIASIIFHDHDTVKIFTQAASQHFKSVAQTVDGRDIIKRLMKHNPDAAKTFTQPAAHNLICLAQTDHGPGLIEEIMKYNPDAAKPFTQSALQHFYSLVQTGKGCKTIECIMDHNLDNEIIAQFETLAHEHNATKIIAIIEKRKLHSSIIEIMQSQPTQSTRHFNTLFAKNLNKLKHFFPKEAQSIKAFHQMITQVIEREHNEQNEGNYTFVHGHPWAFHYLQELDAQLRAIKYNKTAEALSLRFIKQPKEHTGIKHNNIRNKLLQQGSGKYYTRTAELNAQKHMVFMNYALLTNQCGSNTLQYIVNNRCENPPKLMLDKIFENHEMSIYLKKYQQDFDELEMMHREASMFGAGIMFSFTPEMLQKSVFVCSGGGVKRKVQIEGIGETDNIKLILDTLRTHPEKIKSLDHLEFVHVLTKDCALNPKIIESEAVKVIPLNAADPEKLALYEQKRDELMAKIKADVQAERAAWTDQQKKEWQIKQKNMQKFYTEFNCMDECYDSPDLVVQED